MALVGYTVGRALKCSSTYICPPPPPKCPKTVGCARGLIRRDADGDVSKMIGKSVRQEEHKNGREINTYHTDDVRRFFELLM